MSHREDVIRRANDEYSRVLEGCKTTRDEIVRQQRATLASIPEARAAYERYERVLADLSQKFSQGEETAARDLGAAEEQARRVQFEAESAALETWKKTTEAAETTRRDGLASADRVYEEAYQAATRLVLSEQDAAIGRARAARESAQRACHGECDRKVEDAWRAYQSDIDKARESAIAAIEQARQGQSEQHGKAVESFEKDRAAAEESLRAALAAHPLAKSFIEAFTVRLTEAEARCEQDKQAVLDRMRRELD